MSRVVPPSERVCERCGRRDVWDDETGTWVAAETDDGRRVGAPHCLHEWDINGSYSPVRE